MYWRFFNRPPCCSNDGNGTTYSTRPFVMSTLRGDSYQSDGNQQLRESARSRLRPVVAATGEAHRHSPRMNDEQPRTQVRIKLSICVATFNRGGFIAETLDSIVTQMHPEVELVVVDGASTDDTFERMSEFGLRYPFVRYFRETSNSGVDQDFDKAVSIRNGRVRLADDRRRSDARRRTPARAGASERSLRIARRELTGQERGPVENTQSPALSTHSTTSNIEPTRNSALR